MRGTFANVRIKNLMARRAARRRRRHGHPAQRRAAADLRRGDALHRRRHADSWSSAARNTAPARSRDWAAKGTQLLGVKAVIARSFERIHRSNLVGMGVLPLQFKGADSRRSRSGIKGDEDVRRPRPRRRPQAAAGRDARDPPQGRHAAGGARCMLRIDTADRGRLLPARRHPAVRAARAAGESRLTSRAATTNPRGPRAPAADLA